MQPLVSIVTPLFNEAAHIAECIESILVQTYQNWECTILDNCSSDSSVEIARRYAAKDPRIRIVQNREFLPVIRNHNKAIRQISPASSYCKVVFADDWIFPECLERMVGVAEANPSVGIVSAYVLEGERVGLAGLPYQTTVVDGRTMCRMHVLDDLFVFGSANCLLYRADLVRAQDPFYEESNIHADTEICFALLRKSDFGFVHQVLTFSRVRPGSLRTASTDMQSDYACTVQVLQKYGREFLTEDELQQCLKRHLSEYYQFLGKCALLARGKSFWQYHKRLLTDAGVGFSRASLAKGLLAVLVDSALNPKATIEKLIKRQGLADGQEFSNHLLRVHGGHSV